MLKQGDIALVDLNPTKGHEQQSRRPVVILSSIQVSDISGLFIVAPISTTNRDFPLYYPLETPSETTGKVLLDQTRALDIVNRGYRIVDRVSQSELMSIINTYKLFFDIGA
ncbi:type II toxin-antitoxin system PemK/MazF family toxin [Leuconostoc fallax]|nr:type II toxin-antitoxin system PemK/MazF family toxin [Leuconostoc fallax]